MTGSEHARAFIREPAWAGLDPKLPVPEIERSPEVEALCGRHGLAGRARRLRFGGALADMFRLDDDEGRVFFVKLVPRARAGAVRCAEAIAGWLGQRSVAVVAPCDGFPAALEDGRLLCVSPYLEGRRLSPEASDLRALGAAVRHVHDALIAHPDRASWDGASLARLDRLQEVRADLVAGRLDAGPSAKRLRVLAGVGELDFRAVDLPRQPTHGDLNPGNVLVCDEKPRLLDFEDVVHSVLPVHFEIALALERFVLVRTADPLHARRLANEFFGGYGAEASARLMRGCSLSTAIRSLSLRSLCVLALAEREGIRVGDSEWRKFFGLEEAARLRHSEIDQWLNP